MTERQAAEIENWLDNITDEYVNRREDPTTPGSFVITIGDAWGLLLTIKEAGLDAP